jgi:hypothetical protein
VVSPFLGQADSHQTVRWFALPEGRNGGVQIRVAVDERAVHLGADGHRRHADIGPVDGPVG